MAEKMGLNKSNFQRYIKEKTLPDKYVLPLLDVLIELGGGIIKIGNNFIQRTEHEYLVWSIAEEFDTIHKETHSEYPVIIKRVHLSREIVFDLTDFETML